VALVGGAWLSPYQQARQRSSGGPCVAGALFALQMALSAMPNWNWGFYEVSVRVSVDIAGFIALRALGNGAFDG
jgi:hypothetical protein